MEVRRTIGIDTNQKHIMIAPMNKFMVGDVIEFNIGDEEVAAMAMQRQEDGMIFALCDCLEDAKPMRMNGQDFMTGYLAEVFDMFPEEIKNAAKPLEDGSLLRLMSEIEVFGERILSDEQEGDEEVKQFEPMKNRKNRVAGYGKDGSEGEYSHWWLRDVVSAAYFADVNNGGYCYSYYASHALGVRPAFKISDL